MDEPNREADERRDEIAALLLANRASAPVDWSAISHLKGEPCSKKIANDFLLCCLLDYQIGTKVAWANGERLIKSLLGDPEDLWRAITSHSASEWESKHSEYKVHKFVAAHRRLWRTGKHICDQYEGDARQLWEGKDPAAALDALWAAGAGTQISRMIVGALRDSGQLQGVASDVKGDVHVCRVLGRATVGEPIDAEAAVQLARRLNPADPWALDAQLWFVGSQYCHNEAPACNKCYLATHCAYALGRSQQAYDPAAAHTPAGYTSRTRGHTRSTYRLEVNGQTVSMEGVSENDVIELGRCLRAALPAGTRVEYRCVQLNPSGQRFPSWPCPMPRNAPTRLARGQALATQYGLL